jgi:Ca-activated chloride channel family protein
MDTSMNEHTDTTLTDYALGELPEAERLELEARLKTDAAARDEVDEIRRLSSLLRAGQLSAVGAPVAPEAPLTASRELREQLLRRTAEPIVVAAPSWRRRFRATAAVATGIALAAGILMILDGTLGPRPKVELANWKEPPTVYAPGPSPSARHLNDSDINPQFGTPAVADGTKLSRGSDPAGVVVNMLGQGFSVADPNLQAALENAPVAHDRRWITVTPQPLRSTIPQVNPFNYAQGTSTLSLAQPAPNSTTTTIAGTPPSGPTSLTKAGGGTLNTASTPIIHSPTPMAVGDKLVTSNSTATSTLTPRILVTDASPQSPPPAPHDPTLPSPGMRDLLEQETRRFMLGTGVINDPGVVGKIVLDEEVPAAEAAQKSSQEVESVKLGRLLVRNRADAPNVEFNVDVNADGIADTRWIDLGRPSKPGEIPDFQMLTDLMTSTIQPETWREVRTEEELEQRLARHSAYIDFQARLESVRRAEQESNTEQYQSEPENPFVRATDEPLSTFSIDVDTASYSNVRRFLGDNQLPPPSAVRLEEFLNYFTYDYPTPTDDVPFSVTTEAARCPWNADHTLVRIGLKGREVHRKERPASNLVFLVDVSGSMQDQNKLPLVRESLKMMVGELGDSDRVAIVVYAGSEGLALPPTGGDRKRTILETLDRLESGGSTNGAAGIQLAYQIAADNFIPKGINRVILATDGDFNVGVTSQGELVRLIEEKAKTGVFFSALGYGMGNLKDAMLEQLADKGNGNYAYIDTISEARKVLVEQMSGTLMTIAKDVKIQIEFNPTTVAGYRLLGYENRMLAAQDFNDDKKDAGEIGAGHTVTALYELIPVGKAAKKETKKLPEVDPLKYQSAPVVPPQSAELAQELLTLKLRYKEPDGDKSKLIETPVKNDVVDYGKASNDFKFASAVAGFGMLLRHSKYHGSATFDGMIELAESSLGRDVGGYRKEFVELVRKARDLRKRR